MKLSVDRETLIKKLQDNRKNHRTIFEEALEGYREKAIAELESKIEDIRANHKAGRIIFSLPAPEDHTDDYDKIIGLLKMGVDDTITLNDDEYANYVMDEWHWKRSWLASSSFYSATAASLSSE